MSYVFHGVPSVWNITDLSASPSCSSVVTPVSAYTHSLRYGYTPLPSRSLLPRRRTECLLWLVLPRSPAFTLSRRTIGGTCHCVAVERFTRVVQRYERNATLRMHSLQYSVAPLPASSYSVLRASCYARELT